MRRGGNLCRREAAPAVPGAWDRPAVPGAWGPQAVRVGRAPQAVLGAWARLVGGDAPVAAGRLDQAVVPDIRAVSDPPDLAAAPEASAVPVDPVERGAWAAPAPADPPVAAEAPAGRVARAASGDLGAPASATPGRLDAGGRVEEAPGVRVVPAEEAPEASAVPVAGAKAPPAALAALVRVPQAPPGWAVSAARADQPTRSR
jgi:hypothetical protein